MGFQVTVLEYIQYMQDMKVTFIFTIITTTTSFIIINL
jgi:hypothetical protein